MLYYVYVTKFQGTIYKKDTIIYLKFKFNWVPVLFCLLNLVWGSTPLRTSHRICPRVGTFLRVVPSDGRRRGGHLPTHSHSSPVEDSPGISGLPCSQAECPLAKWNVHCQSLWSLSQVLALDCCQWEWWCCRKRDGALSMSATLVPTI